MNSIELMLLFAANRYEMATMDAPDILPAGSTKPDLRIDYENQTMEVIGVSTIFLRKSL